MLDLLILCVIIALVIMIIQAKSRNTSVEGLAPSKETIESRAAQLYRDPEIINSGYLATKFKYNWIDPVIYEHVRKLLKTQKFSPEEIQKSM